MMNDEKKKHKIIVTGYFNHHNLGDEQYMLTFDYLFETYLPNKTDYTIVFIDCDEIKNHKIKDTDIIVVGGGDILNDYFLDKLITTFNTKPNKILAVSVGLPYKHILVNTCKLSIFDYIFLRTTQDMELFSEHFCPQRLFYMPDISYFLTNIITIGCPLVSSSEPFQNTVSQLKKLTKKGKKIICLSLNRHIYHKEKQNYYETILLELVEFVKYLIQQKYYILFLPFNTSNILEPETNMENDILIHNDVCHSIKYTHPEMIHQIINIDYRLSVEETLALYDFVYLTIPMRFHACLFSIYKHVPMIPLYTTKKIKTILLDIQWETHYELDKNEKDIPTFMDKHILLSKVEYVMANHDKLTNKLKDACKGLFHTNLEKVIPFFIKTIVDPYPKIETIVHSNKFDILIDKIFEKVQEYATEHGVSDFRWIREERQQNIIVQLVSYYLTKNVQSKYNHGCKQKMFTMPLYNYRDEWKWILKEEEGTYDKLPSNPNGLFDLHFIDQKDYSGAHRSGWQYVYDHVKRLHNEKSTLYLDLYVDRTFHWNQEINHLLGIIPYKKDWVGFVHHTFDTTFSDYNNHTLMNNPDFINSLPTCKGLFVLSQTLQKQFLEEFSKHNIMSIPVNVLVHPTEMGNHIKKFSINSFLKNKDKKLLHVGGWLRNIFAFYQLTIPKEYVFTTTNNIFYCLFSNPTFTDSIRKVALKGKNMNNYYPDDHLLEKLTDILVTKETTTTNQIINQHCSQKIQDTSSQINNNWNKHFYEHMANIYKDVDILETLDNDDYDVLLSENIVFINLVDSSAINTVIECIVRNTPILVNRHPAVVELLGENYPFYYGNIDGKNSHYFEMNTQVVNLLVNTKNIEKAHKYLTKMDKSKFHIHSFMNDFIKFFGV